MGRGSFKAEEVIMHLMIFSLEIPMQSSLPAELFSNPFQPQSWMTS